MRTSASKAYYNEFNPQAAAWLRELITRGMIAPGVVDERSIVDVKPEDLQGFTQCHFFAGIGGWSYALRLAGWSDATPVWTGSCPCQPFSSAGNHRGTADPRHLWPAWFSLIKECKPSVIFGEQVETAIKHGWLDGVSNDLESEGYAFGSAVLPACSVGAPHIRKRLWFVAESDSYRSNTPVSGIHGTPQTSATSDRTEFLVTGEHWRTYNSLPGTDHRLRRCKPGVDLLVDGVPGTLELLRGYGNAIVPQVAAVFIRSNQ